MAAIDLSQLYSDDVIRAELRNLGIDDISPDMLNHIKGDLRDALERETMQSSTTSVSSAPLSNSSSRSAISITYDPEVESRHRSRFQSSMDSSLFENTMIAPLERREVPSNKENECLNSDPNVHGPRMMKRKIMRHIGGKKVMTEETRPMPNFKGMTINWRRNNSSLKSKSSSTDELWQQMSTVSLSSQSTKNSESSSSVVSRSQSRQSGLMVPNANVKRKKCDPVTRYHEYRKYWDTFKMPGENNHNQLRWTVREKMLEYDFS